MIQLELMKFDLHPLGQQHGQILKDDQVHSGGMDRHDIPRIPFMLQVQTNMILHLTAEGALRIKVYKPDLAFPFLQMRNQMY